MDLYERLRIASSATQLEVDRAYQQMVKESNYDPSIDRRDIEVAYRTLGDPTKRALYDASQQAEQKKAADAERRKKTEKVPRSRSERIRNLLVVLGIALVLTGGYNYWKFGFHFKSFHAGDALYLNTTGQYFGKVIREENDHAFNTGERADAYLVDTADGQIWLTCETVKQTMNTR